MENLNAEREQITNSNNELYDYVKRIVVAVNYKGNCDHEDVPSILRKFAEGYEQRIKELTNEYESMAKSVVEADELIRKLRADKKGLINENEELKNQIQEPFFSEEDIDLLDEYTRLLNVGIRDAKANNLSEIKTRFALRYGTYTDKDMTPIIEVFRLLDQIAKEMLEGEK